MIVINCCKDKVVGVLGLGKTGRAAIHALIHSDVKKIIAIDDDPKKIDELRTDSKFLDEFARNILSAFVVEDAHSRLIDFSIDLMIVSPGIPMQNLKVHKIVAEARRVGIRLVGDLELFYDVIRKHNKQILIGITGSNGKSTTTALIAFLLQYLSSKSDEDKSIIYAAGNIGNPVLGLACANSLKNRSERHVYALEMSSFQLDIAVNIKLDVAVCINITPDHLERYGNLANYALSKAKIFDLVDSRGFCILSVDYPHTRSIVKKLYKENVYSKNIIPFSVKSRLNVGISIVNNVLEICNIFGINNIKTNISKFIPSCLLGSHNAENICSAIAACLSLEPTTKIEEILSALRFFSGLAHRAKLVGELDGIRFVDDSKATNIASTLRALENFTDIYWIVGGKSKGETLEALTPAFCRVKKAYLIGSVVEELATLCKKNGLQYKKCFTLENALIAIKRDIEYPATILLSPAHSSLDQWQSFEERGDYFCRRIKELWDISTDI